ncbi:MULTISPECIES: PEP-CTERM sorting domain-containing protein [unclassified Coleofasciculus]|uniref:PEP-CTERM sorting domain-containing protein n=1 Tax=unclassified Coleofasciculus TaxID=2692782 RepID=UPI001881A457|nr:MULTISPECIES: PEP-CTERM sorting domain-containing protein [unclassified Coleofasciculus]MBE9125979.1 PEP-CTERM sorting domain-containing protein [Coleofasciculus sp. LEGE 07081]MBE9151173.1 PEP-CTERM sorting domain-containing protein [Coleofasciculus sp. LEGE 07092]
MQTTAHKIGTFGLATATVLGLTAFQPAEAASLYTVTDLGTFGIGPIPIAINETSQIVGSSGLLNPGNSGLFPFVEDGRAFLWENSLINNLGNLANLDGFDSEAFDINDSGQIVGRSEVNSPDFFGFDYPSHAFLWENGTMTDLGTFGGVSSSAFGINNRGQVVGSVENKSGEERAFLWQDGVVTDLGTLGGSTSVAVRINDSGQIVGRAETSSGSKHAFLWENGMITDLGTLGGSSSTALDINDSGQVVGYVNPVGESLFNLHAFLWQDGTMTDLGTLDNLSNSAAYGINNVGQVVGLTYGNRGGSVEGKPFIWENGIMIDLNNLITADSGWKLIVAQDINDVGQIVGIGLINGTARPVLLTPESDSTPVPEPLTILGSATALGFGALFKRNCSKRQQKTTQNE